MYPSLPTRRYSQGVLAAPCSPYFAELREQLGQYMIDKTQLIERIISRGLRRQADLVLRPRRCGKTSMLQMLKSFFCIPQGNDPDPRELFDGLDIMVRPDVDKYIGKYVVLYMDFKNICGNSWLAIFWSFRVMVSSLYQEWYEYLWDSLDLDAQHSFQTFLSNKAPEEQWTSSLLSLTSLLARKSRQGVIILIDEYEAPNNAAYGQTFFPEVNRLFGTYVLPPLLKTNSDLAYAVLVGVTPTARSGSGLNHLNVHALHKTSSIFSGMLMFTEKEVIELSRLTKSKLDPELLKAHYNSYLDGGLISVYNPVSIMSALAKSEIQNFWVATGEFPLVRRNIPDCISMATVETLLAGGEINMELQDNVNFTSPVLNPDETLTLLYYAGYLTMTSSGKFKIPNWEVMVDWARWITGTVKNARNILTICIQGPVDTFAEKWPNFMQQSLDPTNARGAISSNIPGHIYQVFLLGLMYAFRLEGWEVVIGPRGGSGYIDIQLVSKKMQSAVLIELKSSKKSEDIERDSLVALDQIEKKNYRDTLQGIHFLREYGIAWNHLESHVEARYLQHIQNTWEETKDPAMETDQAG